MNAVMGKWQEMFKGNKEEKVGNGKRIEWFIFMQFVMENFAGTYGIKLLLCSHSQI
jgi:hypothetical protein